MDRTTRLPPEKVGLKLPLLLLPPLTPDDDDAETGRPLSADTNEVTVEVVVAR